MRLLMVSGDNSPARGIDGAFSATLAGFHVFWERIDILCPYNRGGLPLPVPHLNVFFRAIGPFRVFAPLYILMRGIPLCRRHKPDLIVAHAYGPQFMACGAWLLSRVMKVPIVFEVFHIDGHPKAATLAERVYFIISKFFLRLVARDARAFRVMNANGVPPVLRSLGIPASKIRLIHAMYIDRTIFHPLHISKKYDLIFVGRLAPNKGLSCLLDAFRIVHDHIPHARFLILGTGPLRNWLRRRISSTPSIIHMDRVPSAYDVALLYNQSRVVVCASTAEGGPRFVVEAMACGLPAVSTPVGLMKELVRDGHNGFLVRDWSAESMARAIFAILSPDAPYASYSSNAARSVSHFERGDAIRRYARAYQELIST